MFLPFVNLSHLPLRSCRDPLGQCGTFSFSPLSLGEDVGSGEHASTNKQHIVHLCQADDSTSLIQLEALMLCKSKTTSEATD